jgi:hypothetical protein
MQQLNDHHQLTIDAFRTAIQLFEQNGKPLPDEIRAIVHDLENHIAILDRLSENDPDFETYYQTARLDLQAQAAERNKLLNPPTATTSQNIANTSTPTNGTSSSGSKHQQSDSISHPEVPSHHNVVVPAQSLTQQRNFQEHEQPEWIRRGNSIVAMISGGAFLGVLVGQLPGAIIGAIAAGLFGWHSSKPKTEQG